MPKSVKHKSKMPKSVKHKSKTHKSVKHKSKMRNSKVNKKKSITKKRKSSRMKKSKKNRKLSKKMKGGNEDLINFDTEKTTIENEKNVINLKSPYSVRISGDRVTYEFNINKLHKISDGRYKLLDDEIRLSPLQKLVIPFIILNNNGTLISDGHTGNVTVTLTKIKTSP